MDNIYIFEFSSESPVKIPLMTMAQLDHNLNKKMKSGKSCDIYKLMVKHLCNYGDEAKRCILNYKHKIHL